MTGSMQDAPRGVRDGAAVQAVALLRGTGLAEMTERAVRCAGQKRAFSYQRQYNRAVAAAPAANDARGWD
jgi:hypothetical protein